MIRKLRTTIFFSCIHYMYMNIIFNYLLYKPCPNKIGQKKIQFVGVVRKLTRHKFRRFIIIYIDYYFKHSSALNIPYYDFLNYQYPLCPLLQYLGQHTINVCILYLFSVIYIQMCLYHSSN